MGEVFGIRERGLERHLGLEKEDGIWDGGEGGVGEVFGIREGGLGEVFGIREGRLGG